MPIPEALMPVALAGGVLGNLATKIVEHHLPRLEGTGLGGPLRRIGLLQPNLKERLFKAIEDALARFFERHPQYAVTGVTHFFQDERVGARIADAVLYGRQLGHDELADALREHFGTDWLSSALYRRRHLHPDHIVELFLACYDETLKQHLTEAGLALLKSQHEQTATMTGALAASEQRLQTAIASADEGQRQALDSATQAVEASVRDEGDRTRAAVAGLGDLFSAGHAEHAALLQTALARFSDTTVGKRSEREIRFHERVDVSKELLEQGKPRSARTLLEAVRRDLATVEASDDLRFRVFTNLGACACELDDLEGARRLFQAAHDLQPRNLLGLRNLAWVWLFSGEPERALHFADEARAVDRTDPGAAAAWIRATHALGRSAELDRVLQEETWLLDEPETRRALGQSRLDDGEYEAALEHFLATLKAAPDDTHALVQAATCMVAQSQRELQADPPLEVPPATAERLREADELLTRALGQMSGSEVTGPRHAALLSRSAARAIRGETEPALADCDAIIAEDATNDTALRNKGLLLVRLGKPKEAAATLSRVRSPEERRAVAVPLAHSQLFSGHAQEALEVLLPLWQNGTGSSGATLGTEVGALLAHAYWKLGRGAEADAVISQLTSARPGDPEALSVASEHARRKGDADEARETLERAISLATPNQRRRFLGYLAELHFGQRRFQEAAAVLSELADDLMAGEKDNHALRLYLASLVNSQHYGPALELARKLRATGHAMPLAGEVEALVLEKFDQLPAAIELRRELSSIEPGNHEHLLRICHMEFRRQRAEAAREALRAVSVADLRDPMVLMQAAQLRSLLGEPDALPLAYEARRLGYGSPEIHAAYRNLFLGREEVDAPLLAAPPVVSADCGVRVLVDGEPRAFTLRPGDDAKPDLHELPVTHPVAQQLLGRAPGTAFEMPNPYAGSTRYEVQEVQSKYVRALQDTLEQYARLFPEQRDFQMFQVRQNDFSQVIEIVTAGSERTEGGLELYDQRTLPVGGLARFVSKSIVDVWAGLTSRPGHGLWASTGTIEERHEERQSLVTADALVLDSTAIITIVWLDLQDAVADSGLHLYVTQATLDELAEALTSLSHLRKPAGVLTSVEGRLAWIDVSQEQHEAQVAFLRRLVAFSTERCVVTSPVSAITMDEQERKKLTSYLGASSLAAALLAQEKGAPLFADDLALRQYAAHAWGVKSVWTQGVMAHLVELGTAEQHEFLECTMRLALASYLHTSITADVLIWALHDMSPQAQERAQRLLDLLKGPECSELSAVVVLSEAVAKIWRVSQRDEERRFILEKGLNALLAGRDPAQMMLLFGRAVELRLRDMDLLLREVLTEAYDHWARRPVEASDGFRGESGVAPAA